MEPMQGMLAQQNVRDGGTGAMNTLDLRSPEVQAVVRWMQSQNPPIPVTRNSIAEYLAAGVGQVPPMAAPQAQPMTPVRGAPVSEIANRETFEERQIRERREAEQARMDEAKRQFNQRRQGGMITGR